MTIGKMPKQGELMILNKWYFAVEILWHPPYQCYQGFAFRPYFFFLYMKVIDYGTEYYQPNGIQAVKKGGYKTFTFPFGFCISRI